jgi:hypothetical protein
MQYCINFKNIIYMNNTEISTSIVATKIQKIELQEKQTVELNKLKNQFEDLLNQENIIISDYNKNSQSLMNITDIENLITSNLTICDFKNLVSDYAIITHNKEILDKIANNYYNINTYKLHIFSLLLIYSLQLNILDINQTNTVNCLNLLLLNQTNYVNELIQLHKNYDSISADKHIDFKKCIKIQKCLMNNINNQMEKYNTINTIYMQYSKYIKELINSGVENIDYFIEIRDSKINAEKSNLISIANEFYKSQFKYNAYVFFLL